MKYIFKYRILTFLIICALLILALNYYVKLSPTELLFSLVSVPALLLLILNIPQVRKYLINIIEAKSEIDNIEYRKIQKAIKNARREGKRRFEFNNGRHIVFASSQKTANFIYGNRFRHIDKKDKKEYFWISQYINNVLKDDDER